ncbi:MAG: tetratricopeptide repeat protein [Anaerolineales bacterium]
MAKNFQSLSSEFQRAIELAEKQHGITITPLQELSGGRSGAAIFLVRVARKDTDQVEHLILKLDRVRPQATSDEITRHKTVQELSPAGFVSTYVPDLAFDRVAADGALAIFYTIAGQSLHNFRTLSSYRRQSHLERLFVETNHVLLDKWNENLKIETFTHPQELLAAWLGFRLESGQKIENFIQEVCQLPQDSPGFLVNGKLLPNPLLYARQPDTWGTVRALDAIIGLQHSDLNTNNILARFSRDDELAGYYLIDFALFKPSIPLLFDQRYLEMSYLIDALNRSSLDSVIGLINLYSENDLLEVDQTPVEMAGVNAAVRASRQAFADWVNANHPSLHDDLWGQYWLAGTAAGLGYTHKAGIPEELRIAGLIYAAANLKQFLNLFGLTGPSGATELITSKDSNKQGYQLTTPSVQRHNLPSTLTNFIGRRAEVDGLKDLVLRDDVRLVTLTGPGGTGKTRFAVEAAYRMQDDFSSGVYFVDLSGVTDPGLVMPTIAHTLGIREGGGQDVLDKLKTYLANKEILIILDNFEQVVEAALDISELLSAVSELTILVTSRIPLQLRGEHEYPVSPLEIPPEIAQVQKDTLSFDAVALFIDRAKTVKPEFEATASNQAAIAEICRRLDGLPLAIEIAAARTKLLSPEALLGRLDQALKFLVSQAKDIPDRQQTLEGTIDWSYQLLGPDVQRLFVHLGIFSGGFTLEAAEAICSDMQDLDVFLGIETLINNSLILPVRSVTEQPRFDMLQTIREFALEKAAEAGILEELHRAHCDYFTQLADGGMESGIYGPDSALWLRIYEQEHDNYRQVMAWMLEHLEDVTLQLLAVLSQLTWFWYRCGYLQEGSEWTERAVQATESMGDSVLRAFAVSGRGSLALWTGDLPLAEQRNKEAIELGQRLGLEQVLSLAKMTYGTTLVNMGRDQEAYPHLVDSVELYDDQDQRWLKGTALVHLANVSLGMGNVEQALQWLDTAKPLLNATGDIWTMAFGLNNYGEVARAQGDYEKAEEYYRRTEALYQQADSKGDQARLLTVLGYIAQHKGEFDEARTLFMRSLEEFRKLGNNRGMAECLAGLASLASELGEHTWALHLLSAAEARLEDLEGAWWPADRVEIDRAKERLRSALGDQYDELWEKGQAVSMNAAIDFALSGW